MAPTQTTTDVPYRNIDFDPLLDGLPHHLGVDGDLVTSHIIAVLSSVFPDGESYFIRSVLAVRDQVEDPDLLARIKGFIGQEARHGREHRDLNARLASLGYPTAAIERYVKAVVALCEDRLSDQVNLAITAGLEHYTATLAEQLLTDPAARGEIGPDGVRAMFLWHALEESEHKAVAFDAYRTIGGSERLRIVTMNLINLGFVVEVAVWTAASLVLDPDVRHHPVRTLRSIGRLRRSPFLSRRALGRILDYSRRGFHPDDHDTSDLIDRWRTELFGPHGTLVDAVAG